MTLVSLRRGRAAEQLVARRLTRWTRGHYLFRRRGLGHRGLPDLVVTPATMVVSPLPTWPYPISVKSSRARAPGLDGLARLAGGRLAGVGWRWWREIPAAERGRYWLVWRAHATWWLSADAENPVWHAGRWPAILRLAAPADLLPSWTAPLEHLCALDVQDVVTAVNA